MTWIEERLGKVLVNIIGGGTPSRKVSTHFDGDIPWATVKDLDSFDLWSTEEHITEEALYISASRLVPAGNVILATRIGLGKVAYNHVDVAINQDLKALIPNENLLLSEYLAFFLIAHARMIEQQGVGSTVKGITVKQMVKWLIPLPSIPEQRRIITILRDANRLQELRLESESEARDLPQALFSTLFNRSVSEGTTRKLGDIITYLEPGISVSGTSNPAPENGFGVLKVSSVTTGTFLPQENKEIRADEFESAHEVKVGDLLVSRANTEELVGASAIVRECPTQLMLPDKLWRVHFKEDAEINPTYLYGLLNTGAMRYEISRRATGTSGSMKNISQDSFLDIPIKLPAKSKQDQFELMLKSFWDTVTDHQKYSTEELRNLFHSLLTRAFTGNLTEGWREENRNLIEAAITERAAFIETEGIQRTALPEDREDLTARHIGREEVLNVLSQSQRNLLRLIDNAKGYVTVKSIQDEIDLGEHGLTRGLVQQGLVVLEQTGLIHRINVPYEPADRAVVFYIPAYRAIHLRSDEANDRGLLNGLLDQTQAFRERE